MLTSSSWVGTRCWRHNYSLGWIRRFGRSLPLATLFDAPTVRGLARFYRDGVEPTVGMALVPITSERFSASGVCGARSRRQRPGFYRHLHVISGPEQPFFGLQSVGLDGAREPLESIEQMATHYLGEVRQIQPRGPYHVARGVFRRDRGVRDDAPTTGRGRRGRVSWTLRSVFAGRGSRRSAHAAAAGDGSNAARP